jgi:hypothetical protein
LKNIEDEINAGGWKCLCAAVMLQAVQSALGAILKGPRARQGTRRLSGPYRELARQRLTAREWLEGGVGIITFEDCCDSLGVDPARIRDTLRQKIKAAKHS